MTCVGKYVKPVPMGSQCRLILGTRARHPVSCSSRTKSWVRRPIVVEIVSRHRDLNRDEPKLVEHVTGATRDEPKPVEQVTGPPDNLGTSLGTDLQRC